MTNYKKLTIEIALASLIAMPCMAFSSIASAETDNQDLKQQVDMLQKKVDMLSAQQNAPAAPGGHEYLERKAGNGVTYLTRGGEVSIYGNLDVSLDYVSNGLNSAPDNGIGTPGQTGTLRQERLHASYFRQQHQYRNARLSVYSWLGHHKACVASTG